MIKKKFLIKNNVEIIEVFSFSDGFKQGGNITEKKKKKKTEYNRICGFDSGFFFRIPPVVDIRQPVR